MSYEYTENELVQGSAGDLLEHELGWRVVYAYNQEVLGKDGTLGRESYREILLTRYFRAALARLNPWMTDSQMDEAERKLTNHLSTDSLLQINEKNYILLRDGIPVTATKPNGETEQKTAVVIDFKNVDNNEFLAVKEMKIHSECYRRRTDIVGFVNGIPLLFIELKAPHREVEIAYTDNYTDYLDTIPLLFYYNAFVMLSNGLQAKVGSLGSPFDFFHDWKRLKESDTGSVELETMLRGICKKENFLDLFENFILYDHSDGKTVKVMAANHQYLGVNEVVKAYMARDMKKGKLGVFWHTQGSGKSYSMLFMAKKIRRKFPGSPTFLILTDRDDLNKQISDTFEACGLLGNVKASAFIAKSGKDLIEKLRGNPSFIFTLIQKFNDSKAEPVFVDHDIIIMSDEAHRSQYGDYADNMMRLLPSASRIGFTGTPLLAKDEITKRTFGDYVSIYDFNRAVEDGATVPLYYENRGEKLKDLKNPSITDEMLQAIEDADLDDTQEEKLEKEFENEIHVLTAAPRLRAIAKDFVNHYSNRYKTGKAMFVCLNKVTCVRMYDFVQEYWKQKIAELKEELPHLTGEEAEELSDKIAWMEETEMAVVISQEQNEVKTFEKWGLDIKTHRTKMEKRELDKEFKDKDNSFRVVFVCAMWLTGFDVKCLSILYLDKPMKAHTLMQTIARANRVAEGKENGLIVDYIGIVKALSKALADYTALSGRTGVNPTIDKDELISRVREDIGRTEAFLGEKGFHLQKLVDAEGFEKLSLLQDAENAVCDHPETKKTFTTVASEINRLTNFLDHEDLPEEVTQKKNAILAILKQLRKERAQADTTDLTVQIDRIISSHVQVDDTLLVDAESKRFDISQIDFDLLAKEFAGTKRKNIILNDLDAVIAKQINEMLHQNPARADYYERYQKIITEYNQEQDRATIEKTFMDLMNLARSMTHEQSRYVREGFDNDEELTIYDMLFRDDLSKKDIEAIKKVAKDLFKKINDRIAELDHWTDKEETKADIDNLIRTTLWEELPESYDEVSISRYRQKIYEYVYTRSQVVA